MVKKSILNQRIEIQKFLINESSVADVNFGSQSSECIIKIL